LGVAYITVRPATAILRQRDLIISIHGRGTFITPRNLAITSQPRRIARKVALLVG
jgi:DNA-binding GntR family transcriptional regulator